MLNERINPRPTPPKKRRSDDVDPTDRLRTPPRTATGQSRCREEHSLQPHSVSGVSCNQFFTTDWGSAFRANAARWLWPLRLQKVTYLEIGVFEGRSGCWMLEQILTHPSSRYIGIDSWAGSHRLSVAHQRAKRNFRGYGKRVHLICGRAQEVLQDPAFLRQVDVAYIDGDHRAAAVVEISRLIWPRIVPSGIVIWDDLTWGTGQVARGVERFLADRSVRHAVLFRNSQLGIRKVDSSSNHAPLEMSR